MPKYGREYIRMALEQATTLAWQYWRSIRRARIHGAVRKKTFFADYYLQVRQYKGRHRRRTGANRSAHRLKRGWNVEGFTQNKKIWVWCALSIILIGGPRWANKWSDAGNHFSRIRL